MGSVLMFILFSAFMLFPLQIGEPPEFSRIHGPAGVSTKHKMSEGYQYAVLVLVAASEEEAAKQKEKGLENEYTDSDK